MARAGQIDIRARIMVEQPVAGVAYSLQSKEGRPLDPKRSQSGEALEFDFPLRVAPGPKFYGDQVRREGPDRRFVYIGVGQFAGDQSSPWSRRMKVDIHDIPQEMLDHAARGRLLQITINGTGPNGTPACATVRPVRHDVI